MCTFLPVWHVSTKKRLVRVASCSIQYTCMAGARKLTLIERSHTLFPRCLDETVQHTTEATNFITCAAVTHTHDTIIHTERSPTVCYEAPLAVCLCVYVQVWV